MVVCEIETHEAVAGCSLRPEGFEFSGFEAVQLKPEMPSFESGITHLIPRDVLRLEGTGL